MDSSCARACTRRNVVEVSHALRLSRKSRADARLERLGFARSIDECEWRKKPARAREKACSSRSLTVCPCAKLKPLSDEGGGAALRLRGRRDRTSEVGYCVGWCCARRSSLSMCISVVLPALSRPCGARRRGRSARRSRARQIRSGWSARGKMACSRSVAAGGAARGSAGRSHAPGTGSWRSSATARGWRECRRTSS